MLFARTRRLGEPRRLRWMRGLWMAVVQELGEAACDNAVVHRGGEEPLLDVPWQVGPYLQRSEPEQGGKPVFVHWRRLRLKRSSWLQSFLWRKALPGGVVRGGAIPDLACAFLGKCAVANDLGDDLLGCSAYCVFRAHQLSFGLDTFGAVAAGDFVLRARDHVGGIRGQKDGGGGTVVGLRPAEL